MPRFARSRWPRFVPGLILLGIAAPAAAQEPRPAPHPTPLPVPAPPAGTFGEASRTDVTALSRGSQQLSQSASVVSVLARMAGVTLPGVASTTLAVTGLSASTLASYYGIVGRRHDAMRQTLDAAKAAVNDDLRRAGIALDVDTCARQPARCQGLGGHLSDSTRATLATDMAAYRAFVGSFDPNNWTDGERQEFVERAGTKALLGIADNGVLKGNAYWEALRPARDIVTLDRALQPTPARPSPAEYDAALGAVRRQGGETPAINLETAGQRDHPDYADHFADLTDDASRQMDAASRRGERSGEQFADSLRDREPTIDRLLDASRDQPPLPQTAPDTAALPPVPRAASPSPAAPAAPPPTSRPEHCPNGGFQCPNGNPWPKCQHEEKYRCPPPEHAEEAKRHLSGEQAPDK